MTRHHTHHDHRRAGSKDFWRSRAFLVFLGFAAMAVVLLWEEHRAHFLGLLPYLFLLACPLMHIFMHGSPGGHGHQRRYEGRSNSPSERNGGPS